MKNKYIFIVVGLYFNYLIYGMGVLLIIFNMVYFQEQWGIDKVGVLIVIFLLGIGKLVIIVIGFFLDCFGCKFFIYFGIFSYLIFFVGILLIKNIYLVYVFGIMVGLVNSFFDFGIYLVLMEFFLYFVSWVNVLIKVFVFVGQFLLLFIISFLIWVNLWFGWLFVIVVVFFVLSGIYLFKMLFFDSQVVKKEEVFMVQVEIVVWLQVNKLDMVIFILYGYIGMVIFYLVS